MIVFSIVWTLCFICIQYIVKNTFLTGVKPTEIECITQVQQVNYTVIAVRQVTDSNGNSTYRITFKDNSNVAPDCAVELATLVTGMDIGSQYTAQWLRVVGRYSDYTRTKDSITMQFTNDSIDNTVVQMLKKDVTDALVSDLHGLVRWYYYVELVVGVLIYFGVVLLMPKLVCVIVDKVFVPSDVDYTQTAIDRVLTEKTPENVTEMLDKNIQTVDNYVKTVKRRVYAQQHKAVVKCLDAKQTTEMQSIDVKTTVATQQRARRRERVKHVIAPIAEDIVIDIDEK